VLGYFRAILVKEEISERAFHLTTETIMESQGNYTAWFYRRKLLDELKKPLEDELKFLNNIAIEFEKNF